MTEFFLGLILWPVAAILGVACSSDEYSFGVAYAYLEPAAAFLFGAYALADKLTLSWSLTLFLLVITYLTWGTIGHRLVYGSWDMRKW